MWSWVLHRITGVAIFFFLLVHVLDTALIRLSPEAYDAVIGTYKNPIMGLGETVLVAAIVYHAYNGLRIIAVQNELAKNARVAKVLLALWAVQITLGIINVTAWLPLPNAVGHNAVAMLLLATTGVICLRLQRAVAMQRQPAQMGEH